MDLLTVKQVVQSRKLLRERSDVFIHPYEFDLLMNFSTCLSPLEPQSVRGIE